MHVVDGLFELFGRARERTLELADAVAEVVELRLQAEDLAHPNQADTLVRELLDPLEHRDVAVGVAATAPGRAARRDQALALVDAQGLGMDAGELGGDRD